MGAKKDEDIPDRSGETREGFVPSGKRGWLKVGGERRTVEIQPVTPNWSLALREQRAEQADPAEKADSTYSAKHADPAEQAEEKEETEQTPRTEQEKARGKENE